MAKPTYIGVYCNRKIATVLLLGFASGLPLALSGTLLQAWLTFENVDIMTIGIFSLVGMPYVYKFIWAPLVDKTIFPTLGWRRDWIVAMQLSVSVLCFGMAFIPVTPLWMVATLALSMALMSATQDIAVDAYRTEFLEPEERGAGNAVAVGGYRLGMLFSGGLAFMVADHIGFRPTFIGLGAVMLGCTLLTMRLAPLPKVKITTPKGLQAWIMPFSEFFSRKQAITVLLFILLYKIGDAFCSSLTTAFLMRGLHFSLTDVGFANKAMGLLATILGAIVAGAVMTRMRLYVALMGFGFFQAFTNLGYYYLAISDPQRIKMFAMVFLENFAGGMGGAAYITFIMALCDRRFTATQFALLTALSAVGRIFVGPASGWLVAHFGWAPFYFFTFVVALPGLVLLRILKKHPVLMES